MTLNVAGGLDFFRANITRTGDSALLTPDLRMEQSGPFIQPAILGIFASSTAPDLRGKVHPMSSYQMGRV